jgi:hypothetical protein
MTRRSPPTTLTSGGLKESVRTRAQSGLRARVDEAFSDPQPSIPAAEVFKRIRKLHAANIGDGNRRRILRSAPN